MTINSKRFYFDTQVLNSNMLEMPLEVTLKAGEFVSINSTIKDYYLSIRSQVTWVGDRYFAIKEYIPTYMYCETGQVRVKLVRNLQEENKKEITMKTIKEQLEEFGAQHNDIVVLQNNHTGVTEKDLYRIYSVPGENEYLYSLNTLLPGDTKPYKDIPILSTWYDVLAVYAYGGHTFEGKPLEAHLVYNLRKKKEVVKLPAEIEAELKVFEDYSTCRSTESLRKTIAKYLVNFLGIVFLCVGTSEAEVCPFGTCPKVTPLSCYASMFNPECEGTHIDYGNDQEEWEYISSQMPKQIQVAGNYIHSGDNQAEYFRCKYLRERRLRIGKEFSGWVKVNCREHLK